MTKFIKIVLSFVLVASVAGIFIYSDSQKHCVGCEECAYQSFIEKVKLYGIEVSGDSILQISFVSVDSPSHDVYSFHTSELEMALANGFDKKQLRDSSLMFSLDGEKIINGTCSPYLLKSLAIYP